MKRILIFFLAVFIFNGQTNWHKKRVAAGGGGTTKTVVQNTNTLALAAGSGTTAAPVFGSNVTSGNLIVVFATWADQDLIVTATDTRGTTYTEATAAHLYNATDGQGVTALYGVLTGSGANTVTITFSSACTYRGGLAIEVTGQAQTAPEAANVLYNGTGHTGTDGVSSATVTVLTTNAMMLSAYMGCGGSTTVTAGTNYTIRAGSGDGYFYSESRALTTTTGSVIPTWTTAAAKTNLCVTIDVK